MLKKTTKVIVENLKCPVVYILIGRRISRLLTLM